MTGGLTMGPGAEFTLGLPVVNVVKGMMKSLQKSEDFIHGLRLWLLSDIQAPWNH